MKKIKTDGLNTNSIHAKELEIGKAVRLGKNVKIHGGYDYSKSEYRRAEKVFIGDGVFLADDVEIVCPSIELGDYTMIREGTRIMGRGQAVIGSCCWFGQDSIFNTHGGLFIGNGVGVGAGSQLWTHIRFGDTLQGCQWESEQPMILEDDVWIVGHCLVSPIHAKRKSMAMLGSVITKNMEENRVYAGVPAKDITDKVGPQFIEKSIDQKYNEMQKLLIEFYTSNPDLPKTIQIVRDDSSCIEGFSNFNVSNRTYTKLLSFEEIEFMKFLLVKVKFYPSR